MLIKYMPDFVKNQGYYGTCVGMGLAGWAQSAHKKFTGKIEEMSSGYAIAYSRPHPPTPSSSGIAAEGGIKAFVQSGICPAKEFDANSTHYNCWLEAEKAKAKGKIKTIYKYATGYKNIFYADRDYRKKAIIDYLEKEQLPLLASLNFGGERHFVLAVGYENDDLILLNSYGEKWGDKGKFKTSMFEILGLYYFETNEEEFKSMKFQDVKESDWYYEAVKYAYEQKLMQGKSDDMFEPNNPLTRAEIAQILYNMRK